MAKRRKVSQVRNPKTGLWTKREHQRGRFTQVKTSTPGPFKAVRKEK